MRPMAQSHQASALPIIRPHPPECKRAPAVHVFFTSACYCSLVPRSSNGFCRCFAFQIGKICYHHCIIRHFQFRKCLPVNCYCSHCPIVILFPASDKKCHRHAQCQQLSDDDRAPDSIHAKHARQDEHCPDLEYKCPQK